MGSSVTCEGTLLGTCVSGWMMEKGVGAALQQGSDPLQLPTIHPWLVNVLQAKVVGSFGTPAKNSADPCSICMVVHKGMNSACYVACSVLKCLAACTVCRVECSYKMSSLSPN